MLLQHVKLHKFTLSEKADHLKKTLFNLGGAEFVLIEKYLDHVTLSISISITYCDQFNRLDQGKLINRSFDLDHFHRSQLCYRVQ